MWERLIRHRLIWFAFTLTFAVLRARYFAATAGSDEAAARVAADGGRGPGVGTVGQTGEPRDGPDAGAHVRGSAERLRVVEHPSSAAGFFGAWDFPGGGLGLAAASGVGQERGVMTGHRRSLLVPKGRPHIAQGLNPASGAVPGGRASSSGLKPGAIRGRPFGTRSGGNRTVKRFCSLEHPKSLRDGTAGRNRAAGGPGPQPEDAARPSESLLGRT